MEYSRIPICEKHTNPRITHCGKYWYIPFGIEQEAKVRIDRRNDRNKKPIGKRGENRYKFNKTKNTEELERETKLIHRRLSNTQLNHIHQTTNTIVKTKPSSIVVEDLNVSGMMKNIHLSKTIAEQGFNMFVKILCYKCKLNRIEVVKANWYHPSSKRMFILRRNQERLEVEKQSLYLPYERLYS